MLGILYYGRLETEKGFDAVLELIPKLPQAEFFIFGTGRLESQLLSLTQQKNVHYFGWQTLEKIQSYLGNIDYCLMPSECLETFGLSALNALSRGIPVIGYKKGWIAPFILPEYNLFTYKGKTSAERMLHCIEYHQAQNSSTTKKEKMQTIVADYSAQAWYQHFLALFISASTSSHSSPQKIVLVSDFINKIGGIETYLHDVKALLESQGHQVMLRGGDLPKGIWGRITMRLGLITAPLNFWSAKKFKKFLQTEKPDIIWFNSLLRHLGGNVVKVATSFQQNAPSSSPKIWMMYHDLGYFTPYPSRVSAITEIKTPLNLQHFLAWPQKKGLFNKIAVYCKYLRLKSLINILKSSVDLHLVPSDYMETFITEGLGITSKKVKVLHHFLQQ